MLDFDLEVKTSSGSRLWVTVSTIACEEPRGNRRLIVHLARDVSHRKRNDEFIAKGQEISLKLAVALGGVTESRRFLPFPNRNCQFSAIREG